MSKSLNTELFWDDWYRDTDKLTYAEKGLWIDLIGRCVNSPNQGEFYTALQKISGNGTSEAVWKMLINLGVKGVADVALEVDGKMIPVACDNARLLAGAVVDDYTRVKVVCRRVVREALARKKDAARQAARRSETTTKTPDEARTQGGHGVDTDRTAGGRGGGHGVDSEWLLPRAIRSPSSPSSSNEDSGNQEPCRRRGKPSDRKTGRVEENSTLMIRIGGWFGMKPTTLWTVEQAEKLKALAPGDDEIEIHEKFYAIEDDPYRGYRRRDLSTQLNNWVDDLTKHTEWTREWSEGQGRRTSRSGKDTGNVAVV